jgi:hypothetical protein
VHPDVASAGLLSEFQEATALAFVAFVLTLSAQHTWLLHSAAIIDRIEAQLHPDPAPAESD